MTITLPLSDVHNIASNADLSRDGNDTEDGRGYLYTNYSGRFMYGDTCFGIVGSPSDFAHFIVEVHRYFDTFPDALPEGFDPAIFDDPRTDNMAFDTIYYWPNIKVEEVAS